MNPDDMTDEEIAKEIVDLSWALPDKRDAVLWRLRTQDRDALIRALAFWRKKDGAEATS